MFFDWVTSYNSVHIEDKSATRFVCWAVIHKQEVPEVGKWQPCWRIECAGNTFKLHIGNYIAGYQKLICGPTLMPFIGSLKPEIIKNK